jgi:hypothetical protein
MASAIASMAALDGLRRAEDGAEDSRLMVTRSLKKQPRALKSS